MGGESEYEDAVFAEPVDASDETEEEWGEREGVVGRVGIDEEAMSADAVEKSEKNRLHNKQMFLVLR